MKPKRIEWNRDSGTHTLMLPACGIYDADEIDRWLTETVVKELNSLKAGLRLIASAWQEHSDHGYAGDASTRLYDVSGLARNLRDDATALLTQIESGSPKIDTDQEGENDE